MEITGKRMVAALRDEFKDAKFFFDRQNGWITESWNPIVRIEPQPGRDPTKIFWHDAVITARQWSRADLRRLLDPIAAPTVAPEWSL
eukprot:4281228-Pyramimonas_sp.AAC.1